MTNTDTISIELTKTQWLAIANALGRDASRNEERANIEEGVNEDYLCGIAAQSAAFAAHIIDLQCGYESVLTEVTA